MKNLFKNNDHTGLVTGIVIGSVAAGAAAFLFFTEKGTSARKQIAGQFKRLSGMFKGTEPEPIAEHPTNYLRHKQKAPKTDRVKLLKHEILSTGPADHPIE